ncbi:hypothetical protein [Acetivibrio straminisolvens]|uniref:Uncharacterized protein n=1 Tax=Acetivibrio straminisolvens JCM 21531 TaxID=1294263 RepID=W4V4C5_9FIRM|nr:hypothetical protein [Acetivibrio straminisolvens]GAE87982.1 hypothetical protein JCM21531_1395 [Acetivibrio straminisolvens JCM 21531]
MAREFNRANIQVNGEPVSVRIRGIASGLATDYIISGKYLPDAFTPSNELWGEMIKQAAWKYPLWKRGLPAMLQEYFFQKENTMNWLKNTAQ